MNSGKLEPSLRTAVVLPRSARNQAWELSRTRVQGQARSCARDLLRTANVKSNEAYGLAGGK